MASAGASGHSTVTPSSNRLLQRKWDEQRFHAHKQRLRAMKSSVDNGAPRQFTHIRQNARKHRVEEDRLALIDRHNHELLTRMHHIMHTTGRVDHRNADWKPKRSLNFIKRQQEFERIQRENQAILTRIQTVRPQYSTRQWESDFKVHQMRTKTLSVLPPIEASPSPQKTAKAITRVNEGDKLELPPIDQRPETQPSEIQEEIDIED